MKFIKKIITFIKIFYQKRKNRKLLKKQKSQPVGMNYVDLRKETNVLDVDLIDKNTNQKDKKKVRQYMKCLVTSLTFFACIWISTSYVFAGIALLNFGNSDPLTSLSEKVCETILGVCITYGLKSYLETFSQEKHKLDIMKISADNSDIQNELNHDSNESVG